jgi:UDP-galactopyranose mutase
MVANMLDGVDVELGQDYFADREKWNGLADKVVYTGPIDAYFDYKLGTLEYRSVRFETEVLDKPNFQGNAAVNYTDRETPWTRIIEHKWFEFGKDEMGMICRRRSSAGSTALSGSQVTSRIIRSMIRRTEIFIRNTRSLAMQRRR